MIDRIVIENFKSLRRVDLALGRMNLFVGANGSGKSNLLDALRVLQGIANGFTISEILDGKPKGTTSEVWDGIRGGSQHASFAGGGGSSRTDDVTLEVHGRFASDRELTPIEPEKRASTGKSALEWDLLLTFSPKLGCVTRERLKVDTVIYDTDHAEGFSQATPKHAIWCPVESSQGWSVKLMRTRPALRQFAPGEWRRGGARSAGDSATVETVATSPLYAAYRAHDVAKCLASIQRMGYELAILRDYSKAAEVQRMGNRGENFAALVQTICQDDKAKDAYLSWLRQLRPEEIADVGVVRGAVGEPLFRLRENGRDFPATVLSDGTLRFAAVTAAFFQPDMPNLMLMEEIENGIHASRARLLLELLHSQSAVANTQIVATTHSATVLDWLGEEDYKTTFVCKRDEETGESRICALADVPHFLDVVKKRPVSELFSEGWLEAAL